MQFLASALRLQLVLFVAKFVIIIFVLFVVADAGDRASFELHHIRSEGTGFVGENVFDRG
jgi:hypothetical protein